MSTTSTFSMDQLLATAQDGIFVIDRERRYVMFNEACERITGYRGTDVIGQQCQCGDVVRCQDDHGRSLFGSLCPARAVFEGASDSARQRMQIRRRDGRQIWVETSYTTVRDQIGGVQHILGIVRDMTDAKAAEDDLRAALSDLRGRCQRLGDEQKAKYGFSNVVSKSPAMVPVFERVRAALSNSSPVLVSGESGTGKEVVARTIHVHGLQADGPFVPLNCSALPRDLIESELFGHVKGSFTGAVQDYKGLLRAAEGGTVFLDEIGEMPLDTQAKLLRCLQDKRVRPVGNTAEVPINVRVIAAMNQPPRDAIAKGKLREDLFYRLSVISIDLPPLRDRKEDIPLLVQSFIEGFNATSLRQVKEVEPEAWRALMAYGWPGNVRELSNAVESAFALGSGQILARANFSAEVRNESRPRNAENGSASLHLESVLEQLERETIHRALAAAGGQRIEAARIMGISRSRLYRRMDALGIEHREYKWKS